MMSQEQGRIRECGACGGTGYQRAYTFPGTALCSVCLGSGRISDRMPVADAMADAETLRKIARLHHEQRYGRSRYGRPWRYLPMRDVEIIPCQTDPQVSKYIALTAARAAFRAVPRLRGE